MRSVYFGSSHGRGVLSSQKLPSQTDCVFEKIYTRKLMSTILDVAAVRITVSVALVVALLYALWLVR
jgi:hypothetical protein